MGHLKLLALPNLPKMLKDSGRGTKEHIVSNVMRADVGVLLQSSEPGLQAPGNLKGTVFSPPRSLYAIKDTKLRIE